jgi:glycine cleavage system transcriptional repressor
MLVSMPENQLVSLDEDLKSLVVDGYKVTTTTSERTAAAQAGWRVYEIEVEGADNEGIIHEVAHYLSECGINIESVDSETTLAPVSGSPLFAMTARVAVPPTFAGRGWATELEEIGSRMNLEIRVSEIKDR